jgi:hypothetical protein
MKIPNLVNSNRLFGDEYTGVSITDMDISANIRQNKRNLSSRAYWSQEKLDEQRR